MEMEEESKLDKARWKELLEKYKSKKDLFRYFLYNRKCLFAPKSNSLFLCAVNFFLPSYKMCSMVFLGEICREKKQVLVANEVCLRNVPNWPELGLCHMWDKFKGNMEF